MIPWTNSLKPVLSLVIVHYHFAYSVLAKDLILRFLLMNTKKHKTDVTNSHRYCHDSKSYLLGFHYLLWLFPPSKQGFGVIWDLDFLLFYRGLFRLHTLFYFLAWVSDSYQANRIGGGMVAVCPVDRMADLRGNRLMPR